MWCNAEWLFVSGHHEDTIGRTFLPDLFDDTEWELLTRILDRLKPRAQLVKTQRDLIEGTRTSIELGRHAVLHVTPQLSSDRRYATLTLRIHAEERGAWLFHPQCEVRMPIEGSLWICAGRLLGGRRYDDSELVLMTRVSIVGEGE